VCGLFSLEADELESEPALEREMLDPWFLTYWGSREIVFVAGDEFHAMGWLDGRTLYGSLSLECIYWKKKKQTEWKP
jgi:hypothetical protein